MKRFSEQSVDKLIKTKSMLKGIVTGFGIIGALAALVLYILKASPFLWIFVAVFPITLLPALLTLKAISDQIKARTSNNNFHL